ncbi:hypothetical protein [Paraglaciecola sp. 25GB23A]|uniref:hypothetical protein n=1 Tax=Paraglaciecola sp. 25GB23A TaxID=3156068 RepID=UPI0032AEC499
MINRIIRFHKVIKNTDYVICGSGACAEKIIKYSLENNLRTPTRIVDTINIGKRIGGKTVTPLDSTLAEKVVLCATLEFENEIREKISFISDTPTVYALSDFSNESNCTQNNSGYPIIINTIPKCGNAFIFNTLSKTLNREFNDIAAGPWPDMYISERNIFKAIKNNGVVVDHFSANLYNLNTLKDFNISKMIFHCRDLRQATLSWLHWIDSKFKKGQLKTWEHPPHAEYFSLSEQTKLDVLIEYWLPKLCSYVEEWTTLDKSSLLEIKFTDFSTMADDPRLFFDGIFEFFELDVSTSNLIVPSKKESHFRKGLKNEWVDIFSSSQIRRMNSLIPPAFFERFGWQL